jgi:putative transposase
VSTFGILVFEDLSITRMIKHHCLAKSIADAAWNHLITDTRYKAEEAGRVCLQIDPRGTSQRCSRCKTTVKKDLSVRVHTCPVCGLQIDRDLNAAINILAVGLHSLGVRPEKPTCFSCGSSHLSILNYDNAIPNFSRNRRRY